MLEVPRERSKPPPKAAHSIDEDMKEPVEDPQDNYILSKDMDARINHKSRNNNSLDTHPKP